MKNQVLDDKGSLRGLRDMDALLGWATAATTALSSPTYGIIMGCALAAFCKAMAHESKRKAP